MILPIQPYGSAILRQPTVDVEAVTPAVERLIADMVETMHAASGIGLAAPQVGRSERLFVVDLSPMADELADEDGLLPVWATRPTVYINPRIVEADENAMCDFEEGCLSIPDVRETVSRPDRIRMTYRDEQFEPREVEAEGMLARVLQHEYDHLEGMLFIDYLSALRRRLLQRRLRAIQRGDADAAYALAPVTS